MCEIADLLVLAMLIACSYSDARKKTMPVYLLIIFSAVVGGVALLCKDISIQTRLGGGLLGLFFLLASKCSKEAIGYGDSWIILLLGVQMGCMRALGVLFAASILAGAVSLVFLWKHHWKRNMTLPFVPFLTISYIGAMIL